MSNKRINMFVENIENKIRKKNIRRVMHVISGDLWAGAEVQAYQTINGSLKFSKIQVVCILFNNGILANKLKMLDTKVHIIDEKTNNSLKIILKMREIISKYSPQIIHVHDIKDHFLVYLVRTTLNSKASIVRTLHGYSKPPKNLSIYKIIRSNTVVLLNSVLLKRCADMIIAVSKDLENMIKSKFNVKKVIQINNAIDIEGCIKDAYSKETKIRNKYGANGKLWIGTAARLVPIKNIDLLIEAALKLDEKKIDYYISIFGEGEEKKVLKEKIRKNRLDNKIKLHGFCNNIRSVIKNMDIFVICSKHEGLPMALLEAMCLNTPVICTNVGGMKEVIKSGYNGITIPSENAKLLAKSIENIYRNKEKYERIAQKAYKTVEKYYSQEKYIQNLHSSYFKILN